MSELLDRDWREHPIAILDVETTGVGETVEHDNGDRTVTPGEDRIVELAVVRFAPISSRVDDPVQIMTARVNPGRPIPIEASAVHGIHDNDVADAGDFRAAWREAVPLLEGAIVGAYCASFDRGFVAHHVRHVAPGSRVPETVRAPWLDPYVWITAIDRFVAGKGRHKLAASCERWKVRTSGDWHAAHADAEASGRLVRMMEPRIATYCEAPTLRAVLEAQTRLGRADRLRFRAWLASKRAQDRNVDDGGGRDGQG